MRLKNVAMLALGALLVAGSMTATFAGGARAQSPEAAPPDAQAAQPDPLSAADLENGSYVYELRCRTCHELDAEAGSFVGPNLHGVLNRTAGSVQGATYSPAMAGAGFTWDFAHLDRFLQQPDAVVPGTSMRFVLGMEDEQDRRDVIAFIASASE